MALRQNRRLASFGLPEFLAVLLIGAAIVPVTLWLREVAEPAHRSVQGTIVSCEFHQILDSTEKVTLTYTYIVDGNMYTKTWNGLWPDTGSPDALPHNELNLLRQKGRPLTVFYTPNDPADSTLHLVAPGFRRIYGGLALGLCAAAVLYCALLYPAWRRVA